MVKSLADELSDILDWNEHATGITDVERARAGLMTFCRGLVCGLRAADEQPFVADEEPTNKFKSVWDDEETTRQALAKMKANLRRREEKTKLRPVNDDYETMMVKTPSEER